MTLRRPEPAHSFCHSTLRTRAMMCFNNNLSGPGLYSTVHNHRCLTDSRDSKSVSVRFEITEDKLLPNIFAILS